MYLTSTKLGLILGGSILLSIGLGVIIGYFSISKTSIDENDAKKLDYYESLLKDDDVSFLQEIVKETNGASISKYLELDFFVKHKNQAFK